MPRLLGFFALIPATMLLAVSYFVLLSLRKVESEPLKAFGHVVAVFLWISAALVIAAGTYKITTGKCIMKPAMMGCAMMSEKREGGMMGHMMMKGGHAEHEEDIKEGIKK